MVKQSNGGAYRLTHTRRDMAESGTCSMAVTTSARVSGFRWYTLKALEGLRPFCRFYAYWERFRSTRSGNCASLYQGGSRDTQLIASGVLDQRRKLWNYFEELDDTEPIEKPILFECSSLLSELENKLLPRKEWSGYERVSLNELKEWHGRLTETLGIVSLAEILWSADTLELQCDLERLAKYLGSQYQPQDWIFFILNIPKWTDLGMQRSVRKHGASKVQHSTMIILFVNCPQLSLIKPIRSDR